MGVAVAVSLLGELAICVTGYPYDIGTGMKEGKHGVSVNRAMQLNYYYRTWRWCTGGALNKYGATLFAFVAVAVIFQQFMLHAALFQNKQSKGRSEAVSFALLETCFW